MVPDLMPEDTVLPSDEETGWRPDRQSWENSGGPGAQLAVLGNRMGRIERELEGLRAESKEGRRELRDEMRNKLESIVTAKADAYRITQLESTVSKLSVDMKADLLGKANVGVVNTLALLVFGFVAIILTAVVYNILEARPTILEHVAATDHSGSNPK